METLVENKKKLEVIHEAIDRIIEHRNNKGSERGDDDEHETILLSKLLSQLDALEKDAMTTSNLRKCPVEEGEPSALATTIDCEAKEMELVEIAKELKRVRRQNVITHCLLTFLIIVTTAWQFKEASLLINMKETVTHPIKSVRDMVGDVITNSFKRKGKAPKIEVPPLPPIPELPHLRMQHLPLDSGED